MGFLDTSLRIPHQHRLRRAHERNIPFRKRSLVYEPIFILNGGRLMVHKRYFTGDRGTLVIGDLEKPRECDRSVVPEHFPIVLTISVLPYPRHETMGFDEQHGMTIPK